MTPGELAGLHARCFTLPPPWSAQAFAAMLDSPGSFLLTRPDGFLLGRAIAGEAELLTLAVDPGARRRGTGRALVAAFLDHAAGNHCDSAFLEVAADNSAAIALYLAAGFAQAGRRRAYYHAQGHAPVDALVLIRALSQDG